MKVFALRGVGLLKLCILTLLNIIRILVIKWIHKYNSSHIYKYVENNIYVQIKTSSIQTNYQQGIKWIHKYNSSHIYKYVKNYTYVQIKQYTKQYHLYKQIINTVLH